MLMTSVVSVKFSKMMMADFDADMLGDMIVFAAERLMELEVRGLTGADHGARSPDRLALRTG
jgi:hypothetical protein